MFFPLELMPQYPNDTRNQDCKQHSWNELYKMAQKNGVITKLDVENV